MKGPEELRQAAVDVVLQFTYRPYLVNGVPTPVSTTVNVLFTLGNKKEKAAAMAAAQAALKKVAAESPSQPEVKENEKD